MEERKPDLELKQLGSFIGTQNYYKVMGLLVTDGIKYIMDNGYAWVVTDSIAVIICDQKLRNEPFLCVKLEVKDKEADITITEGDDKVFHKQHYDFTDAKRDLTLFYENGVLLLASEH